MDTDPPPGPHPPPALEETAYNLHVTKAKFFPIYCVCEEKRGQMLRLLGSL